MPHLFWFPNPVNEVAARLTAGVMAIVTVVAAVMHPIWLLAALSASFALRVAFGPRVDPVAWTMVRVADRLPLASVPVPGPPKRFAQLMGLVFTGSALVAGIVGANLAASILVGIVAIFATLESVFGFCAGCLVFGWLMRAGLVPVGVCEECNNVSLRWQGEASA